MRVSIRSADQDLLIFRPEVEYWVCPHYCFVANLFGVQQILPAFLTHCFPSIPFWLSPHYLWRWTRAWGPLGPCSSVSRPSARKSAGDVPCSPISTAPSLCPGTGSSSPQNVKIIAPASDVFMCGPTYHGGYLTDAGLDQHFRVGAGLGRGLVPLRGGGHHGKRLHLCYYYFIDQISLSSIRIYWNGLLFRIQHIFYTRMSIIDDYGLHYQSKTQSEHAGSAEPLLKRKSILKKASALSQHASTNAGCDNKYELAIEQASRKAQDLLKKIDSLRLSNPGVNDGSGGLPLMRKIQVEIVRRDRVIREVQAAIERVKGRAGRGQGQALVCEQLESCRGEVSGLLATLMRKKQHHQIVKSSAQLMEFEYRQMFKDEAVSLEQFVKIHKPKKSKILHKDSSSSSLSHKPRPKQIRPVRRQAENKGRFKQYDDKLGEILGRKNVAQMALKAARRRHLTEMAGLSSRLQFLRDEDDLLDSKISEKYRQLENSENKISKLASPPISRALTQRRFIPARGS